MRTSGLPKPNRVAVIPLRAGSKGLPGKNTLPLVGRPLYRHSIEHAFDAGLDAVLITTDIPEVLEADHPPGVFVHRRPSTISTDDTPMAPVLADALRLAVFDDATVVLLQATSPLRRSKDIQRAIDRFETSDVELVMSVVPADSKVLKFGTVDNDRFVPLRDSRDAFRNRQELPTVVRPDGAIYVFGASWFRDRGELVSDRIGALQVDPNDSADIDSIEDFEFCASVLRQREIGNP